MLARILALVSATLVLGSTSYANQVICDGTYVVYRFHAQAYLNSTDTRVRGDVNVTVVGAGQTRNVVLSVSSSDIRAGSYIRASGKSPQGSGSVDATYNPATELYHGILHGQDAERTYNVNVTCGIYRN